MLAQFVSYSALNGRRSRDRTDGDRSVEESLMASLFSSPSRPGALLSGIVVALTVFGSILTNAAAQDATPSASPAAGMTDFAPDAAAGMTFGLIQTNGDQEYFVDEATGFRETIEAAGGEAIVQDIQLDANAALNAMDTMIGTGIAGIAIVVPNEEIGPSVIEKAAAADIPLIALDVNVQDADGSFAPFAGFDGPDMGTKVGEEAVRLWNESGWGSDGVGILSVEAEQFTVCMDRTNASRQIMTDAGFPAENIVQVPYDGTSPTANSNAATVITANPQFTRWIVFACNDEGVQGVIRALESAGVSAEDTIGVGLGAYLACPEWKSGNPTGFKGALYISGIDVGQVGANALLNAAINDEPLPPQSFAPTTMMTPENYEEAGLTC
jgi:L-arabinose transport system substrate-binding protein